MSDGPRYPEYPGADTPAGAGPPPGAPQWPGVPGAPEQIGGAAGPSGPPSFPVAGGPAPWPPVGHGSAGPAATPAGWWIRVLAAVVDWIISVAVLIVPLGFGIYVLVVDSYYDEISDTIENLDPAGYLWIGLAFVIGLVFDVWNRGLRVGYRGQSLGKQLCGVHVVGRGGQVVGALEGFFRWLVATLLQWTFVGLLVDLLWPLWDERKQTVHDKAINTYPVRR